MLLLSRMVNESVTVDLPDGRTLHVVVVGMRGRAVRLGFDAPRDVLIRRDELIPPQEPPPANGGHP